MKNSFDIVADDNKVETTFDFFEACNIRLSSIRQCCFNIVDGVDGV